MATYDDFKKFIEDGISKGLVGESAVHFGLFKAFIKLNSDTYEDEFLRKIVNIDDLTTLLSNIYSSKAKEFKEFLDGDSFGFGNTWLKHFILWYLCDRSVTYPKSVTKLDDLKKSNLDRSFDPIEDFIAKTRNKLTKESSESDATLTHSTAIDHVAEEKKEWLDWPRQMILWGAPGTGKSHSIAQKLAEIKDIKELEADNQIFRITFHPATDYASFVGSYKPTMDGDKIIYRFQPQSFLNAYEEACMNPEKPVFLIIEEINRGNCAHIFGDIFQLLDRDDDFTSKYPIIPHEDIKCWLDTTEIGDKKYLKLPSNLFIWATMNSSDQSLYKLDSAFQRRWVMRYTPINPFLNKAVIRIDKDTTVKWADFLKNINGKMAKECEDKRMGPFFVKGNNSNEISAEDFVGKVLNYLYRTVFGTYNIENNPSNTLIYDDFFNANESIFGEKTINIDKLKEFFKSIECELDCSGKDIPEGEIPSETEPEGLDDKVEPESDDTTE